MGGALLEPVGVLLQKKKKKKRDNSTNLTNLWTFLWKQTTKALNSPPPKNKKQKQKQKLLIKVFQVPGCHPTHTCCSDTAVRLHVGEYMCQNTY